MWTDISAEIFNILYIRVVTKWLFSTTPQQCLRVKSLDVTLTKIHLFAHQIKCVSLRHPMYCRLSGLLGNNLCWKGLEENQMFQECPQFSSGYWVALHAKPWKKREHPWNNCFSLKPFFVYFKKNFDFHMIICIAQFLVN